MSRDHDLESLAGFERRLRSGEWSPDSPPTQEIVCGGRAVSVRFMPDKADLEEGKVICRTDIARVKQWPADALCRLLMQANNLWAGTSGSTLGLRDDDILMLSISRRLGSISVTTLDNMIRVLCSDAENWSGRLAAAPRKEPEPAQFQYAMHMRA